MQNYDFNLVFPGKPIPLARPRFFKSRVYDPQASEKKLTQRYFLGNYGNIKPIQFPLSVSFRFFFSLPKKSKKLVHKVSTPDLSNLIKFYEDALNGLVWEDDSQIVAYHECGKFYSSNPRTQILGFYLE